jgi:hypothetical protein
MPSPQPLQGALISAVMRRIAGAEFFIGIRKSLRNLSCGRDAMYSSVVAGAGSVRRPQSARTMYLPGDGLLSSH